MSQTNQVEARLRAVLDTNLALSALVFGGGTTAAVRQAWQNRRFTPLLSKATAFELIRVLPYPKFHLSDEEREDLMSDYLPYCESVSIPIPPPPTPKCRDPFDTPFLELAVTGKADFLVTGDHDLLTLADRFHCPIVTADTFLDRLGVN